MQIKASSKDDMERHHTMRHKKPKYHEGKGKHLNGSAMGGQTMGESVTKNCLGSFRTSSLVMSGKQYKIIGNCTRKIIMQEVIIKMMT